MGWLNVTLLPLIIWLTVFGLSSLLTAYAAGQARCSLRRR